MTAAFTLAALVFWDFVSVWHILALSAITGFAQAFGGPAYQSLIPLLVEKEHLPNAIALNSIQFNLARVIGPVVAGAALTAGASVLIRDRFSVRQFWDDVVAHNCTLFQYIGELCRYLANSPPNPNETRHRLRAACGNGLRPDLWDAFQKRFRIPKILEFYGATEGQFTACSPEEWEQHPGTVGRARSRRRLEIDDDGLVWCAVPSWARFEYWRDPARTARDEGARKHGEADHDGDRMRKPAREDDRERGAAVSECRA